MKFLGVILLLAFLISCGKNKNRYDPDNFLSAVEKDRVKEAIVRYAAKPPRRVMDTLRFDSTYNEYYADQSKKHFLLAYYESKNGEQFFLISRIAPSLEEKWVATGGRLRLNKDFDLVEYEEVFRTWKLPKADLDIRARYLFDLMVKGDDLTPYYTASAGFNYIEFPDENVYFDKEARTWKSKLYGSVEEMVYESRDSVK